MAVLILADVKAHLNITVSSDDAKINAMIAAAEAAIAERVGPLAPEARTVRVTPYGRTLFVPAPAVSLTSVTDADGTATRPPTCTS